MALVVEVSTKLNTKYESTGETKDDVVTDYLDNTGGEDWKSYIDGEYKKSNENNKKTLGGCTRNNMSEDNDENGEGNYDVQMEKIMQRFTNFNQILSETSGQDDDDEDEDEDASEYIKGEIGDDEDKDNKASEEQEEPKESKFDQFEDYGTKIRPVNLEAKSDDIPELERQFSDNEFWGNPKQEQKEEDIDYDALLAELEG
jgi:hypothetical protein